MRALSISYLHFNKREIWNIFLCCAFSINWQLDTKRTKDWHAVTAVVLAGHSFRKSRDWIRTQRLHLINEANVVLIPKANDASSITDFRPISLINSLAKIITKILADRLAPRLQNLVSNCQNAFIKKRCIQDNFIYVQSVIKALHKAKRPSFFIKLDISKAFDSVSWVFLLEILQALGFGQRWRDWIATLLATSSSKILLSSIRKAIKACKRFTTGRSAITDAFYSGHWPPSSIDRVGST
jgi:hypothetical protein